MSQPLAVARPLRGVKGAHESSHKSAGGADWWSLSRTSLDPSPLPGGFSGSEAKADASAALGFARKARG